jgi:hypothetical protein
VARSTWDADEFAAFTLKIHNQIQALDASKAPHNDPYFGPLKSFSRQFPSQNVIRTAAAA